MIRLVGVSKTFVNDGIRKTVADGISLTFPDRGAVALVGRNGAGKSTLLQMIAGTTRPTSGSIESDGLISWPIGLARCAHPDLSGMQNARFVARIYGVDTDALCNFVAEFSELGEHFFLPVRTYSSGMRARLNFALSMGIDFDTYLIDEVTSVGDASFRVKSEAYLRQRLKNRAAIVVSHGTGMLKRLCQAAVVVEKGKAMWFDTVHEALTQHRRNLRLPN